MKKESKAVEVFNKLGYADESEKTEDSPVSSSTMLSIDSLVPSYKKDKVILALADKIQGLREDLTSVSDHRDRLLREKEDNYKVTKALPIILEAIRVNNI